MGTTMHSVPYALAHWVFVFRVIVMDAMEERMGNKCLETWEDYKILFRRARGADLATLEGHLQGALQDTGVSPDVWAHLSERCFCIDSPVTICDDRAAMLAKLDTLPPEYMSYRDSFVHVVEIVSAHPDYGWFHRGDKGSWV